MEFGLFMEFVGLDDTTDQQAFRTRVCNGGRSGEDGGGLGLVGRVPLHPVQCVVRSYNRSHSRSCPHQKDENRVRSSPPAIGEPRFALRKRSQPSTK